MQKTIVRRVLAVAGVTTALLLAMVVGSTASGYTVARADTPYSHSADYECGSGYYENSTGSCTKGPDGSPTGIRCEDGTYSHATTTRGACSRHGGIADSSGGSGTGGDPGSLALGSLAIGGLAALGGVLLLGSSVLGAGLFGS